MSKKHEAEINRRQNIMPRCYPVSCNKHVELLEANLGSIHK